MASQNSELMVLFYRPLDDKAGEDRHLCVDPNRVVAIGAAVSESSCLVQLDDVFGMGAIIAMEPADKLLARVNQARGLGRQLEDNRQQIEQLWLQVRELESRAAARDAAGPDDPT